MRPLDSTSSSAGLGRFILERPAAVALVLPWLLVMWPFAFLSSTLLQTPWFPEMVNTVAEWIPMIDRMARGARDPAWTRAALACLWASGPVWFVAAAILGLRTLKARIYPQKHVDVSFYLFSILLFSGVMLVLATIRPSGLRRVDLIGTIFTDGWGLFTIGWFPITCFFVVFGLIAAIPLSRLFGVEHHRDT
ncbi:hypothetical protein [Polaromonas sp. YR568]|uniref:hypothetical protein n=1 Tax=Polaromonas sp. YR568 TaxID=1855301 RepID=UPI000B820CED|nr:hypothetical protein [Polaromonas sp. YR568]